MYSKIINLPGQIKQAYEASNVNFPKTFEKDGINRLVICGMGGSAISGDIAKAAFQHLLPIEVVKGYNLPFIDKKTLVVILSYSGNTEETLSCFYQAKKRTTKIAAVTSGGTLREEVEKRFLWVELPTGYPPRSAIGFLFFSLIKILENYDIIENQQEIVNKTIANLVKKADALAVETPEESNLAKMISWTLFDKIPLIYSSVPELGPLAYRWKCQINENAKYPAFHHTFSEMNHNEIEGWESRGFEGKFIPIFLQNMNDDKQTKKRIIAFKNILEKLGIEFNEFFTEGDSYIERVFSLIYFGDMLSYYLALLKEVNPTTIEFIMYLKENIN